jgi:hypothetical protein
MLMSAIDDRRALLAAAAAARCVMFGRQYAAALLLANAGSSAMKVLIGNRPELADWITFTPDFGFIQVSYGMAWQPAAGLGMQLQHLGRARDNLGMG